MYSNDGFFFALCRESGVNGMECNRKLKENFYLLNSGDSGERIMIISLSNVCSCSFVRLLVCSTSDVNSRKKNVLFLFFSIAVNKWLTFTKAFVSGVFWLTLWCDITLEACKSFILCECSTSKHKNILYFLHYFDKNDCASSRPSVSTN